MPYSLRSRAAAGDPPLEAGSSNAKRCKIILRLQPRNTSVAVGVPNSSIDAYSPVADPADTPAGPAPLEPLFLGIDDNASGSIRTYLSPSPQRSVDNPGPDFSLASPPLDLYDIDSQCPLDLTTPECQAAWEAELARSPTPPPGADEFIDVTLAIPPSSAVTLVFAPYVQPLIPPPRWVGHHTSSPPPPNCHIPTNSKIAVWSKHHVVRSLMVRVVNGHFPRDWGVS
ncbi:related to monocarboxylate permease [Ustilago sp. UG-2017b]|nr:related to monocarboxylate permease [Ustilago sp. UG-2017b]